MSTAEPVSDLQIERYYIDTLEMEMVKRVDGEWVSYDDHIAILSALSHVQAPAPVAAPVQVKALDELHKLLCAIPNNDRGLSWQRRDAYSGAECLEVHGAIAKAFKYILDNTDAIRSALVAAPSRDDVVRVLTELRDEDDSDRPASSERKAGWRAALDAVDAALRAIFGRYEQ